ncbi:MAG TPA: hypothetical protein VFU15_09105, partial [Bacteroidia bacterium]|nr:hypothetical protein [Bacteroidia bacterium]
WALPEAPFCAAAGEKNELLILSERHLFEFDPSDDSTHTLLKNGFWDLLYPNSMVLLDHQLYIGMRSGVLRVDYEHPEKQDWFTNE